MNLLPPMLQSSTLATNSGDHLQSVNQLFVLCFDLLTRPKMPFKVMHRKEVIHSNGSYERKSHGRKLADEMGRARKIPMVHYRVMYRKRVTSELHDSYFRLMTIKTFDFKDRVGIERLYNSAEFDEPVAVELKIRRSYRRNVVGKATSGWRGLWALISGP